MDNKIKIDKTAIDKLKLLLRKCDNCIHVELIDVSEYSDTHDIISMCGLTGGSTGRVCKSYEERDVH